MMMRIARWTLAFLLLALGVVLGAVTGDGVGAVVCVLAAAGVAP